MNDCIIASMRQFIQSQMNERIYESEQIQTKLKK